MYGVLPKSWHKDFDCKKTKLNFTKKKYNSAKNRTSNVSGCVIEGQNFWKFIVNVYGPLMAIIMILTII